MAEPDWGDEWEIPEPTPRARPSRTAIADTKRRARSADNALAAAYEHGRSDHHARTPGTNRPAGPAEASAYDAGLADAKAEGRQPAQPGPVPVPGPTPPAGPGRAHSTADSGAGILLGMVGYVIVVNFLRGGFPAVKGWFGAKFVNKAYTGTLAKAGPPTGVAKLGIGS